MCTVIALPTRVVWSCRGRQRLKEKKKMKTFAFMYNSILHTGLLYLIYFIYFCKGLNSFYSYYHIVQTYTITYMFSQDKRLSFFLKKCILRSGKASKEHGLITHFFIFLSEGTDPVLFKPETGSVGPLPAPCSMSWKLSRPGRMGEIIDC